MNAAEEREIEQVTELCKHNALVMIKVLSALTNGDMRILTITFALLVSGIEDQQPGFLDVLTEGVKSIQEDTKNRQEVEEMIQSLENDAKSKPKPKPKPEPEVRKADLAKNRKLN